MPVTPWSWQTANPTTNKPSISCTAFDATAAEVQRAYNALVNRGPVSQFETQVWNDICAKIREINMEWQTRNGFGDDFPGVWIPSPHIEDYPDYSSYAQYKNIRGVLRSESMNAVANSIYTASPCPWEPRLGRRNLKKGDDLYGEYILWVVDALNYWCTLSPLFASFTDMFKFETNGKLVAPPILPIFPHPIDMHWDENVLAGMVSSLATKLSDDFVFAPTRAVFEQLKSKRIRSLLNFHTLSIACNIYADNVCFINPIPTDFLSEIYVNSVLLRSIWIGGNDEFIFRTTNRAIVADDLAPVKIRKGFSSLLDGLLALAPPLPASIYDSSHYNGTGKIITKRPIPFRVFTNFLSSHSARLEFDGIEFLDMANEAIRILSAFEAQKSVGALVESNGNISITNSDFNLAVPSAEQLNSPDEHLLISNDFDTIIKAFGVSLGHQDSFSTEGTDTIVDAPSASILHQSSFCATSTAELNTSKSNIYALDESLEQPVGTADLTFANEEGITTNDSSFRVVSRIDDIQSITGSSMDSDNSFTTSENISLDSSDILQLVGCGEAYTISNAEIRRDQVKEQEADATIRTSHIADILSTQNSMLEIDCTAASMRTVAELVLERFSELELQAVVSSSESAAIELIMRKLCESEQLINVNAQAALLQRMMRFLVGTSVVSTEALTEITACLPYHTSGREEKVQLSTDSFLDANFVRGDSCKVDARIENETDAELGFLNNRLLAEATSLVRSMTEVLMQISPSSILDTTTIAESQSEATIVMAKSVIILASEYEDSTVSSLEDTLAIDVERHLIL